MDPLVPLTLSLVRSPGRYALLLGSGISRAAGIPTGAAVVERLRGDAAAAAGAGTPPDLFAWFRSTFGATASYADVLRSLGPTAADRQRLIRAYIEPAGAERPQPTPAHHAIAELIESGAIRIVVTTNFDDLLERALTARGVPFHVVASPDAIEGAPPFAHGGTFIYKVHGDYRDERLLNTLAELSTYDARVEQLVDRLFDEFGLIVCGWSGDSDVALRAAIERVRGRRFATYWMTVGGPSDGATALINQRDAELIRIRDADTAFSDLRDRVLAMRAAQVAESGDEIVAAALLKRYLADPSQAIRLHDAVMGEVQRLKELFATPEFAVTPELVRNDVERRLVQYETATRTLRAMLMVLGYWGSDAQASYIDDVVTVLLQDRPLAGFVPLINLTPCPAVLAANAFAVGAYAARRYSRVARFMDAEFAYEHNGNPLQENGWELLIPSYVVTPPVDGNHGWWWSDRLATVLASTFKTLVAPGSVKDIIDRFEHFVALRLTLDPSVGYVVRAAGRGAYRKRNTATLLREAQRDGESWPGFAAGFPAGDALTAHAGAYDRLGLPKDPSAFALNIGIA